MISNEDIEVVSAEGYHDGFYWDYRIRYRFKGEPFTMMFTGSGSGFMRCVLGIWKGFPELLKGRWNKEYGYEPDFGYVEDTVRLDLVKYTEMLKASGKDFLEFSEEKDGYWYSFP